MTDPKIKIKTPAAKAPAAKAPVVKAPPPVAPPKPPQAKATAPAKDAKTVSKPAAAAIEAPRTGGALHTFWEEAIALPVKHAQEFWKETAQQGGLTGAAGTVMGTLLDVSGVPAIANEASAAMDNRKSASDRLKNGGLAAGNIVITFVPLGKVAGVGAKAFKIVGGAKALQKVKNVLKLGAEVPAGTVIKHFTHAGAATNIAADGVLGGSSRGFLTWAGKGEYLAVTTAGLKKRTLNNGQIYAMAADGKTSTLGKVIDVVVGVGGDTTVGRWLGKISPPKTGYSHVIEHALTAEEAVGARRWGKTIVTNVPTGKAGLAITAAEVKAVPGVIAGVAPAPASRVAKAAEEVFGKGVETLAKNADFIAAGYAKLLITEP